MATEEPETLENVEFTQTQTLEPTVQVEESSNLNVSFTGGESYLNEDHYNQAFDVEEAT